MCLPLVVWWTCLAVTTVFEIEPVSGPLEVFLLQGYSGCPDVRDNLKALPFFCKVGGGPAWNLTQCILRQINFRKMTCRSEGTENNILLELATSRYSLKSLSEPLHTDIHAQKAHLAGSRALLQQIMLCMVSPYTSALPLSHKKYPNKALGYVELLFCST